MKPIIFFSILSAILFFLSGCTDAQTSEKASYSTPEWSKGIIWYQIFPERFRNGDDSNNPTAEHIGAPEGWKISSWTADWYARPDWEKAKGPNFTDAVFDRRYGGDLQGVIDKLDYLKSLGVGGIYFNPVFDARTLHKYDATYYHHIDRFFGPDPEGDTKIIESEDPADPTTWQWTSADKLFLKLLEEAHKRDIKIIIDGVWNHTGPEFWAFQDIVKNQQNSEFKEWYDVISFDDPATADTNEFDFHGWWGFKGLPELQEENGTLIEPVREHIFAVTRRWMDPNGDGNPGDGIDGWRLDVAEEVGQKLWTQWHDVVREINPDAYTTAEIWTDKAVEYINEEQFNAVMNYRFAYAVQDFMIDREIDAQEFMKRLAEVRESYPAEANHALQNLVDSHDTPRIASMILNPGLEYDRDAYPRDGYELRKPTEDERDIQKLIALFQYTYLGSPMIYYGTEAGMWGADDPHDRKPMVWDDLEYEDEINHPFGEDRPGDTNNFEQWLFDYYALLGKIRNENPALQKGDIETLHATGELVVFSRSHNGERVIIALNRSKDLHQIRLNIADPNKTFTDLLTGFEVKSDSTNIILNLQPVSGQIIK